MADTKEKPQVRMVCGNCGSDHVLLDAWAEWDEEAQEWVLGSTFDHAVCESEECDGKETHIEEEPIGLIPIV